MTTRAAVIAKGELRTTNVYVVATLLGPRSFEYLDVATGIG